MIESSPPSEDRTSASDLIQRIKLGTLDPGLLSKEQRQLCVEALFFESVSMSGIAQFLKVTDRTIRRDLTDIRQRNSLDPDPTLVREIVGEYVLFTRMHKGNLMKLARNSAASTGERTQAEYYAYLVGADMITKLQSLGYLPKSADALVVMQKKPEDETSGKLSELAAEIDAMTALADSPEQSEKLTQLKNALTQENKNVPKEK